MNERIQRQRQLQACRTNTHTEHVRFADETSQMEKKRYNEQEQRMQAIKGVSMFYARSSRINSSIIQVE